MKKISKTNDPGFPVQWTINGKNDCQRIIIKLILIEIYTIWLLELYNMKNVNSWKWKNELNGIID